MRDYKRITLLCGHYGSGKTNIAVNMAFDLKNQKENVAIADLDIVNPYFRTKDSIQDFNEKNIRLICSEYANSNVDIPALPQDMYAITDDKNLNVIIDVGGDDRGALALGRLSEKIKKENNYEMLMVVNFYRPLTQDVDSMIEVMKEIEFACNIKITGLINNSNLGELTTPDDILKTVPKAKELSEKTSLPIVMTSVEEKIYKILENETENLFSLRLQKKPI